MRWYLKVAAFNALSIAPGGHRVYRLLQDRITGSLTAADDTVSEKVEVANGYLDYLRGSLGVQDLEGVTHIDVGAGWMPTIPLVFYAAGCERQMLCDVDENLRIDTLVEVVSKVRDLVGADERLGRHARRLPPPVAPGERLNDYLARLGARYLVPYDLSALSPEGGAALITSTQVLLHLSPDQLAALFRDANAVIASEGLLLSHVHLHDVYSDKDARLSAYNKWRYSPFVWDRLINSRLMSFNRLTASGYREILQQAGLEVLAFDVEEPTDADLAELDRTPIHRAFRSLPRREVAARNLFMSAKSRRANAPFPRLPQSR